MAPPRDTWRRLAERTHAAGLGFDVLQLVLKRTNDEASALDFIDRLDAAANGPIIPLPPERRAGGDRRKATDGPA